MQRETSPGGETIANSCWRRIVKSRAGAGAFWRYAVIGIAQNAFFYSLTLLLLSRGWAAWQSMALIYPAGTVVSFIANRSWTFGADYVRGQFSKYALLYGATYPVSVWLTWLLEHEGIPRWLATLITMAILVFVFFAALRNWVFATPAAFRGAQAPKLQAFTPDGQPR